MSEQRPDQDGRDLERTIAAPGTSPAQLFAIGATIGGHYKITALLGRGGMGVVYRAQHLTIGREYALKALAAEQVNEANWRRFQSEGKAIARLEHRNIVKVYDMGVQDGRYPYYVMDLLDGPSLADFIAENGPLSVDYALPVFAQICSGLGFAHQAGLVHRDVKPSNIILTASGVKIVDFGLVKTVVGAVDPDQSLTATGDIFGSPYYMSPEQCLGDKIDPRSDIYSLGCTFFEALTGTTPFRGDNAMATVLMHQNKKAPTLRSAYTRRKFSVELEHMIATMLSKQPSDRQPTMAAVQHELARLEAGKTVRPEAAFTDGPLYDLAYPVEDKKADALPFILLGGVVCLLIAIAGGAWYYFASAAKPAVKAQNDAIWEKERPDATLEEAKIIFRQRDQISRGIESANGQLVRHFKFPSLPVGELSWQNIIEIKKTAQDHVSVPVQCPVTLTIEPPLGRLTLAYPEVLAGIAPTDIAALKIESTGVNITPGYNGEAVTGVELPANLFSEIKSWTGLQILSVHNYKIRPEVIAAMSAIHPVKKVFLITNSCDGADIAQLKWIQMIAELRIKAMANVDAILFALSGSDRLQSLNMDQTQPSINGLRALSRCPKLWYLSAVDADLDDQELAAIANIPSLASLTISHARLTKAGLKPLQKCQKLVLLVVRECGLSVADTDQLKKKLPHLRIDF